MLVVLFINMSSSVQLTVDAARSTATRLGNSFSISGSNIDTTDGTTAGMLTAGTISSGVYTPGTIAATQDATGGEAFSFSTSFLQGDALPTSAASLVLHLTSVQLPVIHTELLVIWQVPLRLMVLLH